MDQADMLRAWVRGLGCFSVPIRRIGVDFADGTRLVELITHVMGLDCPGVVATVNYQARVQNWRLISGVLAGLGIRLVQADAEMLSHGDEGLVFALLRDLKRVAAVRGRPPSGKIAVVADDVTEGGLLQAARLRIREQDDRIGELEREVRRLREENLALNSVIAR